MKTVQITIPDSTFETLREMARTRGTTVTALCEAAAISASRPWSVPIVRQVAEKHAHGFTNRMIAADLGLTIDAVKKHLYASGLRSNPVGMVRS